MGCPVRYGSLETMQGFVRRIQALLDFSNISVLSLWRVLGSDGVK